MPFCNLFIGRPSYFWHRYPGERAYSDSCRALVTKYTFLQDRHCMNGPNFVSHYLVLLFDTKILCCYN